jgi:hypothetical protein
MFLAYYQNSESLWGFVPGAPISKIGILKENCIDVLNKEYEAIRIGYNFAATLGDL